MDMSGNAWEWTNSWYDEMKIRRVVRGGSWSGSLNLARAASRSNIHPAARGSYIGFRVVGGAPFPIS
jgi:formylglycine-generating enzyme required for sulfatase activity